MARSNSIQVIRTTRATLNTQASAGNLLVGEPYLITDEGRIAIGLTTTTYQTYSKDDELAGKADLTGSTFTGDVKFTGQAAPSVIIKSTTTKANGAAGALMMTDSTNMPLAMVAYVPGSDALMVRSDVGSVQVTSVNTIALNSANDINLNTSSGKLTLGVNSGSNLVVTATGATVAGTLAASGAISAPNHLTTMSGFCSGKPAASEVVAGQIFPVGTTLTQASCTAKATVAATASTVFTIKRNGTSVGTITFAATATLATVSISASAVSANDHVTIEAPATADGTLANISFLVRA